MPGNYNTTSNTTGSNTTSGSSTNQDMYRWETEPQAMYNQYYGIPTVGQNPWQSWNASNFAPAYAGWNLNSMKNPGQFAGPTGFRSYLGSYGSPQASRNKLSSLYGQYQGAGPQAQYTMMDALGKDVFDQMNYYKLQNRYSPAVASYWAGQRPALGQQWNVSPQMMGGGNWMNWLLGQQGL